jgi:hypothetical protein
VILLAQLQAANQGLSRPGALSDAAVHVARKQLKAARATLRLLRALIGTVAYRRANLALRDAAAPLGAARDAAVLLRTLDGLCGHEHRAAAAARALRPALLQQRRILRARLRSGSPTRRTALARLTRVAQQARRWRGGEARAPASGQPAIRAGLTATYRSGRQSLAAIRRRASDAALHEWRKQSKYLANELLLVCPRSAHRLDAPRRRAARIAHTLGTDHDLALLRRALRRHHPGGSAALRLRQRIELERARLQRRALASGERLYRLAPREFIARLSRGR